MTPEIQSLRFFAMQKRVARAGWIAGCALGACELGAVWGQWQRFAATFAALATWLGFNLVARSRVAPLGRGLFNGSILVLSAYVSGWPLASWLFLAHFALALDATGQALPEPRSKVAPMSGRVALWTIVLSCAAQDVGALACGVSFVYPFVFTVLVWFCLEMSRARLGGVREILERTEQQRAELERAHLMLHDAHVGLTLEIEAHERMQEELRQAQRLEAVGRLAAGVAHEINTPVQFVSDSLHFVSEATRELLPLIDAYRETIAAGESAALGPDRVRQLRATEDRVDLTYVVENAPVAIDRALEGLGRIATIVRSLKEFAHPDSGQMAAADLNKAVQSTLNIAKHEYKLIAELETDYAALPPVMCYLGELNQVVLNIVVNAAHAIEDVVRKTGRRGSLKVRTAIDGEDVVISVADSGGGIPLEIRDRIFDPFFTTKGVGKGTGQGLAIARSVIEKHGGKLTFECQMGQGTTFFIRLPLGRGQPTEPLVAAAG